MGLRERTRQYLAAFAAEQAITATLPYELLREWLDATCMHCGDGGVVVQPDGAKYCATCYHPV